MSSHSGYRTWYNTSTNDGNITFNYILKPIASLISWEGLMFQELLRSGQAHRKVQEPLSPISFVKKELPANVHGKAETIAASGF